MRVFQDIINTLSSSSIELKFDFLNIAKLKVRKARALPIKELKCYKTKTK